MASIRPDDFTFLQQMLKTRSGLVVTPDKAYLLESRLTPIARSFGHTDLSALVTQLRGGRDERLAKAVVDAMTTNESSFFRDGRPFEQFRAHVLPSLVKARSGQRALRVWSAACSSGQEAYSIAMCLLENKAAWNGFQINILGTDLSTEILDRARDGKFSQFEVQRGLPIQMLVKYFEQAGDRWQVRRDIRSMVQWREFNLLDSLTALGSFDIVFCRNVLIYFDQPTKRRVLEAIARQMPEDGYLFLGGAETVLGITDRFQPVDGLRGIYQLAMGKGARPAAPAAGPRPGRTAAPAAAAPSSAGSLGGRPLAQAGVPGGRPLGGTGPAGSTSAGGRFGKAATTGTGAQPAASGLSRPSGTGALSRYANLKTKR